MSMSNDHGTSNHHVVILGGGITGLSAAFHLARKHPTAQITLIEKSTRFGGWVRSERVDVRDAQGNTASVLLEAGPRTLRPNATAILELVRCVFHSPPPPPPPPPSPPSTIK
jgi:oxygen-dependent protoporphyrinogen oxidase